MKQKVDLLYVEDNEDYIDFVKRAVRKVDCDLVYDYVTDGEDAVKFFENSQAGQMRLILLDIKLPGMNGFDLLRKIRANAALKHTPVVMFSSSDNPKDIHNSYAYGANAYLVKPAGMQSLTETMKTICDFWLSLNYCKN